MGAATGGRGDSRREAASCPPQPEPPSPTRRDAASGSWQTPGQPRGDGAASERLKPGATALDVALRPGSHRPRENRVI